MASLINFTRIILQSLDQASFNILNDNSLKGRTVLKLSFILDVLAIPELVQQQVKQTTTDQGIMIYSILKNKICVSASSFFRSTGCDKLGPVSVCIQRKRRKSRNSVR